MAETSPHPTGSTAGRHGRTLLAASVVSVVLALLTPPGVVAALAVAFLAVWFMPRRPARRQVHVAALTIALLGVASSVLVGIADTAAGM